MKCRKPKVEERIKKRMGYLYRMLKQRFYTRQELMEHFHTEDRQVRDMLAKLSHKVPVIAVSSSNNGYKVATTKDDLKLVEQTLAELQSRKKKLDKRIKALADFRKECLFGYTVE